MVVLFGAYGLAESFISNGDFELYEPNETLGFNTPNDWQIKNYAAVVENFIPNPQQGNADNWRIDPDIGLYSAQGNSFLLISTGDVRPDPNEAWASQNIYANEGERISGFYFFGTSDYMNYNDFGTIRLEPDGNNPPEDSNDVILVYVDVNQVGDHNSMPGWQRFDYVFDSNHTGEYKLVIWAEDEYGTDYIFESYFAVDGLVLCDSSSPGDIYLDCCVDFTDFALFSTDWLKDCDDPNYHYDPNSNHCLGTDLDNNGLVDTNDLWLFSENWLF
jgi:hypothetical protein